MNKYVAQIVFLAIGCAAVLDAWAQPVCDPNNNVIKIDAGYTNQAKTTPYEAHICKPSSGGGTLTFDASDVDQGDSYVIFKCQKEDPVHPDMSDCRSPLKARNPNEEQQWVVSLNPGRSQNDWDLRNDDVCIDNCKVDEPPGDCLQDFCSYPYMVVSIHNNKDHPLDPTIIITP